MIKVKMQELNRKDWMLTGDYAFVNDVMYLEVVVKSFFGLRRNRDYYHENNFQFIETFTCKRDTNE